MPRILLTLIFFLGAIGGAIFYVLPQSNIYMALRSDTGALERISQELDGAGETRDLLRDKIKSVSKADLERVELVLPKGSEREYLIRVIDYYGAENGVAIKSIAFVDQGGVEASQAGADLSVPRPGGAPEAVVGKSRKEMEIILDGVGSYDNMKRFLDLLEKHIRIIDVESVTFPAMQSPAETIKFSIKAKTYYQ